MSKKQTRNKELEILKEVNKQDNHKISKKGIIAIASSVAALIVIIVVIALISSSVNNVVKINGEQVSKKEFDYYLNYVKTQIETNNNLSDESAISAYWAEQVNVENAKETAMSNLKQVKITYAKAIEQKMQVADEEIDALDSEYTEQRSKYGASVDTAYYIPNYGTDFNTYRRVAIEQLYADQYNSKIYNKAEPKEKEVKKEYNSLKKEGKTTLASVRHILLKTTNGNGDELTGTEKKEKQRLINKVYNLVKANPNNMVSYVKKYSEDNYEDNMGLFEFYKDGTTDTGSTLVSEFPEWAFKKSTTVGSVGKIKSVYGTHIVRLEKKTAKSYSDMKSTIKSNLWYTNYSNKLSDLADKANIKINESVYNSITIS